MFPNATTVRRSVVAGLAALLVLPGVASAHIRYVVDDEGSASAIVQFVVQVLSDPVNAALVGGGALALVLATAAFLYVRPATRDLAALRAALDEYGAYVPWMLRLSVGLPLVGAGFAGYFFSPAVPADARLLQVALGFLLLFGLATRATAAVGLLVYLLALVGNLDLLLAAEYVGGFAAIALLGAGRPSADHMLARVAATEGTLYGRVDPVYRIAERFGGAVAPYRAYAPAVLRVVVGAVFVLLGLWEKLAHPTRGLAVVAKYDLTAVVPVDPGLWVLGAGLVEATVGLLLIAGLFTRAAAAAAFLTLTLTLFGLPDDPVLAHVTLFGFTSALFVTGAGPLSLDRRLFGRALAVDSRATTGATTAVDESDSEDAGSTPT